MAAHIYNAAAVAGGWVCLWFVGNEQASSGRPFAIWLPIYTMQQLLQVGGCVCGLWEMSKPAVVGPCFLAAHIYNAAAVAGGFVFGLWEMSKPAVAGPCFLAAHKYNAAAVAGGCVCGLWEMSKPAVVGPLFFGCPYIQCSSCCRWGCLWFVGNEQAGSGRPFAFWLP